MMELSQVRAETIEQPVADATEKLTKANTRAMDVMFRTQHLLLDELLFAGNEMLDRTKTETHLFTEFVAKMAEAHSVKNIQTLWEECGQHQIDFVRRDTERLFRHGQRILEKVSGLFNSPCSV
jgi:hypothetical protein